MLCQLLQQMPTQLLRRSRSPQLLAAAAPWKAQPGMASASLKTPWAVPRTQAKTAPPALSSRTLTCLIQPASQQLSSWVASCIPILSSRLEAQLRQQLHQASQTKIQLHQVAEKLPQQLHQTLQA